MNHLDRLETLAQRLIEGIFNCLFQTQLSPAISAENGRKNRTKTQEVVVLTSNQDADHWLLRLEERELRLGEPVVRIGRALDNDIVISDPAVSRYHAQLRWREGCYHICPPTPANGGAATQHTGDSKNRNQPIPQTTVNRQAVVRYPLTSGDVITLGDTNLTVMVERETA